MIVAELSLPLRPLQLLPGDRLIDLHRALYPVEAMPDGCELESLVASFECAYGKSFATIWHDDITLRDMYAYAKALQLSLIAPIHDAG
jgi:hypothetical protein